MTGAAAPDEPGALAAALRAGDRAALARAITLIESRRPDHRALADALLEALMPHTGGAERIGITGVPGAGKSTLIEALGTRLADAGRRVAVLAIDPSSAVSGGSILGDKTRMTRLANHPLAFVRPSPTAGTLGGVAARTGEAILLCEAAGHEVVLVETVGVGQSETLVAELVDAFVVLVLAGAGDTLQGIKRGLLEMADVVTVHKADGAGAAPAAAAARELATALALLPPRDGAWRPPVVTSSALAADGLDALWAAVAAHRAAAEASGAREARRRAQRVRWLWATVEDGLVAALHAHPAVAARLAAREEDVRQGRVAATAVARELLAAFGVAEGGGG